MTKLSLFTLWGAGVMMLILGVSYRVYPQMRVADAGMQLQMANEFHVIRSAYRSAFLGTFALFSLGAWRARQAET